MIIEDCMINQDCCSSIKGRGEKKKREFKFSYLENTYYNEVFICV